MNKLILASGSPRRKEMLSNLGIELEIIRPTSESPPMENEKPWDYAKRLSFEKLQNVRERIDKEKNLYILAADTIVVIGDNIMGKPRDKNQWRRFLRELSGNWHKVYTGYTLVSPKKSYTRVIRSKVRFINISDRLAEWYLSTGEGLDKAGGYAIQGKGSVLIKEIRGSFTNIIGLPIAEVVEDLNKCNFF